MVESIDLSPLAIPVGAFVIGFLAGYFSGVSVSQSSEPEIQRAIAMLITFAWVLSLLANAFLPAYKTPIAVHAMMGAVAGYLFQLEDGTVPIPQISLKK